MTFLTIRAVLLWLAVSVNVVGGAVLFKRLFPRESPWFGLVIPELALVILLNFIEHFVALPSLLWAAPIGTLGSIWLFLDKATEWRGLRLPVGIFLACFAFTLGLRCAHPEIAASRDGICDLALVSNYCNGEVLPVTESWLPPYKDTYYYSFMHYTASVIIRLLKLDTGTGFNLSAALIAAYICYAAAAAAFRLSRGKVWIAMVMPFVIESAATGSSAFLWWTSKAINAPAAGNPYLVYDDNPYVKAILKPQNPWDQAELSVPGSWSWVGAYHPTTGGQFLVFFSVWCLAEVLRRRKSNWPWISATCIPVLGIAVSTWSVPMTGLVFLEGMAFALYYRLRPQDWRFVLLGVGAVVTCLMPTLMDFLTTSISPSMDYAGPGDKTQPILIFLQWWPIYLPWMALGFIWHRLSPAVKCIYLLVPGLLVYVEFYNLGFRCDMTGKYWGYTYALGVVAFFPVLASRRHLIFRILTGILLLSSVISFGYYVQDTWTHSLNEDVLHLEGTGEFRREVPKARLLQTVALMHHQTLFPGRSAWAFNDNSMLCSLTGNSCYVTWSSADRCGDLHGEATRREFEMNAFYDGKNSDPLLYVRSHNIAGIVIWQGDNISDDALAKLKQQLAPAYEYRDFREGDPPSGTNVGLFIYHPTVDNWMEGKSK